MSKINILCIPADNFGVGNFRFIEPHIELQKQFGDDFYVDINFEPNWNDENYLNKFDIIFGSKNMMQLSLAQEIFPKLQAKGKKIIIDVDDYWILSPKNPQYQLAKDIKHSENSIAFFKLADYVVTTTEFLAKEVKKYNENVLVFANAVDPSMKKFQIKEELSERVRLGYLGGSSHFEDLKLLKPMYTSILTKYPEKVQTVLCGFDLRGKVKDRDAHGNEFERPMLPEETPWYYYEKFVTSDYKNIDNDYKSFLNKYKNEEYSNTDNLPYRRVWTKPISSYSLNYNLFDISLIPLVNDKYNCCKSQLKIIEAGFFKKAIIASDVSPYQIDIKHGVNGFLVKEGSSKDFTFYAKKLINEPSLREEMGNNLYETVKDKYNLKNVTKSRGDWYKTLINK